jgi:hypothetical protein
MRRLLHVALTAELNRLGLDATQAATAAAVFADEAQDGRAAAELFREGKTLLVVTSDGARVVNAHKRDAFESAISAAYGDLHSATVVNCNGVVERAKRGLANMPRTSALAGANYRHGRQMYT